MLFSRARASLDLYPIVGRYCHSYPLGYNGITYIIQKTDALDRWLFRLKDARGKVAILRRITRAKGGNLGDVKPVGGDVTEMRLDVGPGYRLCFTQRGGVVILLLCGGDKSIQPRDMELAKKLAGEAE